APALRPDQRLRRLPDRGAARGGGVRLRSGDHGGAADRDRAGGRPGRPRRRGLRGQQRRGPGGQPDRGGGAPCAGRHQRRQLPAPGRARPRLPRGGVHGGDILRRRGRAGRAHHPQPVPGQVRKDDTAGVHLQPGGPAPSYAGTRHRTGRGKGSFMTTDGADAHKAVEEAARAARGAVADLAGVPGERLDEALRAIADGLVRGSGPVLAANEADMTAAREAGLGGGLLDRLRLDEVRLAAIADQLRALAGVPYESAEWAVRELPDGLVLTERRRPVGVIGANFEARPNVVVDIASQFVKSRNAGVLRTGSAAIRSAITLADEVIAPALDSAGLDPAMIQLVRVPGQSSARALVSQPGLIPLVILRGSGDSTRSLAAEAARHGVRTMAHADGGAVLYVDAAADLDLAGRLIEASLDRLGVCNRLNLLLLHPSLW